MALEQQSPLKLQIHRLTLSDGLDEFFLYQRANRHTPRTIGYYEFTLGKMQSWLKNVGIEYVDEVTSSELRRFGLELADSGLADSTVHNHMRAVRAFFRFLEREGIHDGYPMRNVRMPKVEKKILPAFTESEVVKLLKDCEGSEFVDLRNRLLVRLLLDSGLRLAECASLKVGTVDPQTGIMKVMGKGRKERVTRISAETLRTFRKYVRAHGGDDSAPLWIGRRGSMTQAGIAETLEKIGRRVGVHTHPHKFRRTCAIRLLRNGADVFSVQLLLGHSDIGVLRRYLAQSDEDILTVHERCTG